MSKPVDAAQLRHYDPPKGVSINELPEQVDFAKAVEALRVRLDEVDKERNAQ